ncbi:MAG: hypothetical protein UX62_C0020G0009 [Microgenomates group bacterium GW2011_GWA2_46_7]|nr:MAG: hypothetical protein UX62_C0020G0009 [Microgenomates group bacterium GW2011_GWA2_46_7]
MTMATKTSIFHAYKQQYWSGSKSEKYEILTHICFVTRMHRKAAIRRFATLKKCATPKHRGRMVVYTPQVTQALKTVWSLASEVCAELLTPMIPVYVATLKLEGVWTADEHVTTLLFQMREATIRRRIATFLHTRDPHHGVSATSPSSLKTIIPIFTGPWSDKPPGYGQIDTVVHCGSTLLGDMVFTLNYTDVATLWTHPHAQWNKGQYATQQSMAVVQENLPFPWLGAHPDTGSEFINRFVVEWCQHEHIALTRSRPYHKNDNAHIEERNGHIIRKFVGYQRLDVKEAVSALNALYAVLALYLNHFIASRKCIKKERVGSQFVRRYDTAQTPYQRVMSHAHITQEDKDALQAVHETLRMCDLKHEIDRCIQNLYDTQRRYGTTVTVSNDL